MNDKTKNMDYGCIRDLIYDNRAQVEREKERIQTLSETTDAIESLLGRVETLEEENAEYKEDISNIEARHEDEVNKLKADYEAEINKLKAQLEKEANGAAQLRSERDNLKAENAELNMKLDETNKMMKRVAEKAEQEGLLMGLRKFINQSKRKRPEKREYIKNSIWEMVNVLGLVLPEDMREELMHLDDVEEQPLKDVADTIAGAIKDRPLKDVADTIAGAIKDKPTVVVDAKEGGFVQVSEQGINNNLILGEQGINNKIEYGYDRD